MKTEEFRIMYLPQQFNSTHPSEAVALMRAYPLASLISVDEHGLPFISHIPMHLEECGQRLVLLGHCAKANPHWQYLLSRAQAVVTFMGPQAYLSPAVYPDLVRVPTWNYLAVHCTVQATLIEDAAGKEQLLKKLIADHEPAYAAQWQGLSEEFVQKMLAAIVGFELQVLDLQCKLKLNQHRPESHARMLAAYTEGTADEQALAKWLVKLGIVAVEPILPA
jgi:transcriptional regulator